jgi:hypothetical protein
VRYASLLQHIELRSPKVGTIKKSSNQMEASHSGGCRVLTVSQKKHRAVFFMNWQFFIPLYLKSKHKKPKHRPATDQLLCG